MRSGLLLVVSAAMLVLLSSVATSAEQLPGYLAALSDSIYAVNADFDKQAQVRDILLERGGAKFLLQEGVLTLTTPVLGQPIGAVFKGKGRFLMEPPNRAEKYMLARHCKEETADWEFDKLALFFTDQTYNELNEKLSFVPLGKDGDADKLLAAFVKYQEKEIEESFPAQILPDLLQKNQPGRFMARFKGPCGKMIFAYDPKKVEEVNLLRHAISYGKFFPDWVCSFHSPDQYSESIWGPDRENKDLIDEMEYDISCKIWQSAKMDIDVELSFTSRQDSLLVIPFLINHDMVMSSLRIADQTDSSLFWHKLNDENGITVYLTRPLKAGERWTLKFHYSSKGYLDKTPWGNNVISSSTYWYPRYGYLRRAKYKLKFACPDQYEFLAVGRKVSEKIEDGFKITEWDISDYPVAFVSYNYGTLMLEEDMTLQGVPVEVYVSGAHTLFKRKKGQHNVTVDVSAAASLFSELLTPYPFDKLLATEIPSPHGQGLPGFLHLAWSTFDKHEPGLDDAFRAHEVAHQWWGHIVGWQSYHDQWLSEGFAEYMAALYIQEKYRNDKRYKDEFFKLLDRWRDDVMESGSFTGTGYRTTYKEGNDAGPIWMGRRLASSKSSDYTTLVYSKGAYVLHMLRMMMFDFVSKDDSRFYAMLRDFIETYYWQEATTADFQQIAEKHYGADLTWFFDQFVYDTQIPRYKWRAVTKKEPDNQYLVTIEIETKEVRDDFQMLVPITVIMEGDYHTTTRLLIDKPNMRITLPRKLPYKPVKFIFNSYKSVLCQDKKL